ncbi:MAG TPA: alcohol dehydrogenase catalytic domain-containing protein [Bacillota bacterium]|nr:alcohol dehydrogenase catalytic domain-containing protein [Bacillota bacterium]HOA15145.1 alcohol dehydrogenase catalytic domain-containing protein [Bacillota bacterium]
MKAIVKYSAEPGDMRVMDMPKPKPGPGEVLVQIKATGICYSDISILDGKYKGRKPVPYPVIMGHEGAGIVAELGAGVTDLAVGDRIGFEVLFGCGKCENCRNGNKNMCSDWGHYGITTNGTFAEYLAIKSELAHKLPDNVSFANAAFLEPISLTVRSIEHVKPMVGDTAAIIGPGSIGLLHLQALKAAGCAKVIVLGIEKDVHRFEIAKSLGADHIVVIGKEDPIAKVKEYTKGLGVDIVIETAAHPSAFSLAIELAASKGRISTFGLYPEATVRPIQIIREGLTIFGDVALLQKHFLRAIRWVEYGKVSAEPIITKRFKLEQAAEAVEANRQGNAVKVLFEL